MELGRINYMKLYIPRHISRSFIQSRRNIIFLYGFDVRGTGCLGQAWAAHGEPNAFPIPTLYKFCPSGHVLFTDSRGEEWRREIDKAIARVPQDGRPIIPFPRIGEGCSRLREIGPETFKYLKNVLHTIEYKEVEWLRD